MTNRKHWLMRHPVDCQVDVSVYGWSSFVPLMVGADRASLAPATGEVGRAPTDSWRHRGPMASQEWRSTLYSKYCESRDRDVDCMLRVADASTRASGANKGSSGKGKADRDDATFADRYQLAQAIQELSQNSCCSQYALRTILFPLHFRIAL